MYREASLHLGRLPQGTPRNRLAEFSLTVVRLVSLPLPERHSSISWKSSPELRALTGNEWKCSIWMSTSDCQSLTQQAFASIYLSGSFTRRASHVTICSTVNGIRGK